MPESDKSELLEENRRLQEQLKASEWELLSRYLHEEWWNIDHAKEILTGCVGNVDLRTGRTLDKSVVADNLQILQRLTERWMIGNLWAKQSHSPDHVHPDDLEKYMHRGVTNVRFDAEYVYAWAKEHINIPWQEWANHNGYGISLQGHDTKQSKILFEVDEETKVTASEFHREIKGILRDKSRRGEPKPTAAKLRDYVARHPTPHFVRIKNTGNGKVIVYEDDVGLEQELDRHALSMFITRHGKT